MTTFDPLVTPEQILQDEAPEGKVPPIAVTIDDPVQTREMPAKHVAFESWPNLPAAGQQIVSRDPRRKWYVIIANTGSVMLGSTQGVSASTGGILSQGMQSPKIDSSDEVWASSVNPASLSTVTVISSFWAD